MVIEQVHFYRRQYNVLSTIRIKHIYTKFSINGKIYKWYLIDNLNYQAIPIKCRNRQSVQYMNGIRLII